MKNFWMWSCVGTGAVAFIYSTALNIAFGFHHELRYDIISLTLLSFQLISFCFFMRKKFL